MEQRYENLNLTDIEWYLTEINKIFSDEVEIMFFTTPIKVVENNIEQLKEQRSKNLRSARFWKTWFIRDGKNTGKGTIKAPFPSNPAWIAIMDRTTSKVGTERANISQ